MSQADLISILCTRGFFSYLHYGIDIGDGTVVHLATNDGEEEMSVQRVSMEQFAGGASITVEQVENALPNERVIELALTAVGKRGYHLFEGNCEHFAREIKTGNNHSIQIDMVIKSIVRTALSGIANTSSRTVIASSIAALTQSRLLITAGSLVPTLFGETARCSSYFAARHLNVPHTEADKSSRAVGHAASAIGGFAVGGPIGSLGALAVSIAADRVTESMEEKFGDQSLNS